MDYALIGYPLSDRYRKRFEELIGGAPTYLSLQELRRQSLWTTLRTLPSLKPDRLFIAIEGDQARGLLPVFYCFAGASRARSVEVIHPDFTRQKVTRWQTITSLTDMLTASWDCRRSLRRVSRELQDLLAAERIPDHLPTQPSLFYLKSNLWLGVQAGGSVGHVAGVVNSLLARGYGVDFAATEPPLMVDAAARFIPLNLLKTYGVPYELNLFRFQEQMAKQLAQETAGRQYGFLYQRLSVSNYAGVQLSRKLHLPLVLEYNGSEVWAQKNWGVAFRDGNASLQAEEACLKHAHVVVTVSDVLRDELIERGVAPERIVSHPNGIDPDVYSPDRFSSTEIQQLKSKWQIPADARLAVFVGTFGPWHGVEVLAEGIRQLASEHLEWLQQSKLHFLIVGDGLRMPQVREILSDERCRPFFTLTGLVPQGDAPVYMAAADLLLSPHVPNTDGTRFFGSPTKLFEYMAMGKPIVASDLEQIGEVLRNSLRAHDLPCQSPTDADTKISILCRPGDVAEMIAGIKFLIEHPQWGSTLGRNARREALAKFTWDQHVAAILNRLTSLGKHQDQPHALQRPTSDRKAA